MEKVEKFLIKYRFFVISVLLAPAVWALFVPGYYGASDDIHIAWLYEMDQVIKLGQFPPRYVPDLSFGFGYPLFSFVFPLPFYIAEIVHLISRLSFVDSVKSVFFLSVPLSFFTMYLLLKRFSSQLLSIAGALVYVYTPYRATDLYVRGAIGELFSFAVLPIVALSVIKLSGYKFNLKWIGIGGLSLSALILTHNITAYMFYPTVILLWLVLLLASRRDLAKKVLQFFLMNLLGLAGSIYFWLPAIIESKLFKYDTVFNFTDHFPTLKQLFTPYFGYGASVPGPFDGLSFFIGFINILLVITAFLSVFLYRKKYSKTEFAFFGWLMVILLMTVFMMNFRSTFVWENVPLIPYFQFPWRFLILTTFITPLFIIFLEKSEYKNILAILIIISVVSLNGVYFRPHDFLGREDSYFLDRYIPYPKASEEYKKTQEEYLRLPKDLIKRPDQNYPLTFPVTEQIIQINPFNRLAGETKVKADKDFILYFNKYYYPGWQVKIDKQKTEIFSSPPFGQVSVKIPSGEHLVEILFKETVLRQSLNLVSLLAIILSLSLTFQTRLKENE
ncbi:hypothetical protein HYW42_02675 [Candidatus Daviesbacteria bacterium]|nr:hypothetical protein [Candidatus Daviesbacteria bacterium]